MDAQISEILRRLRLRERKETTGFKRLIVSHTNLQEQVEQLRKDITRLEYEKQRLERFLESEPKNETGSVGTGACDQRAFQKELIDAIKKKSEYADKVCEMTDSLKAKEAELALRNSRCRELEKLTTTLQEKLTTCERNLSNANRINQAAMDENQSLQLLCNAEQSKNTELNIKFDNLMEQLLAFKAKAAEELNEENVRIKKHREEQQQKKQEEALRPKVAIVPPSHVPSGMMAEQEPPHGAPGQAVYPDTSYHAFDAHDVEVSALCFSPDGNYLATGGGDKIVKVWNVRQDLSECASENVDLKCSLSGATGGVMSIQFDQSSKTVLAASSDNNVRIWTLHDQITRHTLIGHSNKVMAAKFLEDNHRVVTGSHDRTLKIWDLQLGACIKTISAGSSCNDVIAGKHLGSTIISGHFDQRLRFWDVRTFNASEIALEGRITSLDYHPDRYLLLCCSRDNVLRLVDLRQNAVTATFRAEGFSVTLDWSRACFSPDGQYIAAGSSDGTVFVWEVSTGKVRSRKEHSSVVVNCAWHPSGQLFASAERTKKVIMWSR